MKKYYCRHCGRLLFEGFFVGRICIICRKCKIKNDFVEATSHKDCVQDAQSDFSSDCLKATRAY